MPRLRRGRETVTSLKLDGLPNRAREHCAKRCAGKYERVGRVFDQSKHQHPPDQRADEYRREYLDRPPKRPTRAAMILGQRAQTARASGHCKRIENSLQIRGFRRMVTKMISQS